ncbi:MAG: extracellular solute-binding protein [Clostridia bacterium]|nr:extracellular solute-binding protein [Clostridia bacterium]
MKRTLSVILAAIMLLSAAFALSSCAGGEKITVEPGPFGKYTPSVKISYSLPFVGGFESSALDKIGYSVEFTPWTEKIEQDFGIRLVNEWAVTDNSAYMQKLTSSIAISDIPDILNLLSGEDIAYSYAKSLYENDLVREISDLIENYASDELKESIEVAGEEIFYPVTFAGGKYAMPQITDGTASYDNIWWLRKDWLDNLNLDVPTDWDSFAAVLTAFSNQDPDGNGAKDTYGLSMAVTSEHYDRVLFNSLGAYPYMWLEDENGDLVYGSIQPEMKSALEKIASLYASGVIYPDLSATRYLGISQNQSGMISGTLNFVKAFDSLYRGNTSVEFVPVKAFSMVNGVDEAVLQGAHNAFRYWTVSKDCEYPETMVKLFNHYIATAKAADSDNELYNSLFTDIGGLAPVITSHLKADAENAYEVLYDAIESQDDSLLEKASHKNMYNSVMKYLADGDRAYYGDYLLYARDGSYDIFFSDYSYENFTVNKYNYSKTATMVERELDLNSLQYSTFYRIITGEATIDEFDIFVTEWKNQGGNTITAEVNAWYDSMKG